MSKVKKQESEKSKKKVAEPPKKKSTGLRSAVRLGEISPELALHRLEEARSNGEFVGEEIINWLKNRKKALKKKKKSVEPVEEQQEDGNT